MKKNEDRRSEPRIAFRNPVSIIGLNQAAQVIDFSLSGFFIKVDDMENLKLGQMIRLALRLPHEESSTIIKAKISRIEKDGFGCEFLDLSSSTMNLLESTFNFFSCTLPID